MRITVATSGSRGDVQPYIALGLGLQAAGHTVRLATHANFETEIRNRGLDFSPIEGDPRQVMQEREGQAWQKTIGNPLAFTLQMSRIVRPLMERMVSDCWNACRGSDAVVFSMFGWFAAHHVVEKLSVPGFPAYLQPITRTRAFPALGFPTRIGLGGIGNWLTYPVSEELVWRLLRDPMNQVRRRVLGLGPMRESPFAQASARRLPIAYGFSPHVLPKPSDWADWIQITGYWFLDAPCDWQAPVDLVAFLNAGAPPVYIGFGSMGERKPEETTAIALKALALSKQRGILASGWSGIGKGDLPDTVFQVEAVPHDWLFPRMAAVVHHGGVGTTAAGLRAGVPTITVPFFADQPFWGQRVFELGVGTKPIPRGRLSAKKLADAIRAAVSDKQMRARAVALGERIRAEEGVARAVEVFHRSLGQKWN